MKSTKELRIGNRVLTKDNVEMSVFALFDNDIVFLENKEIGENNEDIWKENISNIKGIPLTEEILLKYEFNIGYDGEFTKRLDLSYDSRFYYLINKQNKDLSGIIFQGITFFNEIKYLHQLQNFYYAITGKTLFPIFNVWKP